MKLRYWLPSKGRRPASNLADDCALRESIDDGEELNALKLNHTFAIMQTERWIEARIAFLLANP
jgi:hypothetical protein